MNICIRIVLQQRIIIVFVLVLRGAILRTMTGIRGRVGWGNSATIGEIVGVAEGMIVVVARHEMRDGV